MFYRVSLECYSEKEHQTCNEYYAISNICSVVFSVIKERLSHWMDQVGGGGANVGTPNPFVNRHTIARLYAAGES